MLERDCPQMTIVATCSNTIAAKAQIEILKPDIVFLDIQMPGKSGIEMIGELKEKRFEIIFVTAHNEYTLDAFHYSAIDYLMKPIDEDKLIDAVRRAVKRVAMNSVNNNVSTLLHNLQKAQVPQEMKLCIPSLKGFQVVELKDILYCEASGSYTNFFFVDKHSICTAKTIHDYEDLLEDAGFVRIHKSFLVNLLHVKEYLRGEGGSVILSNGHEVEVARRKKDLLIAKMKEYYKF